MAATLWLCFSVAVEGKCEGVTVSEASQASMRREGIIIQALLTGTTIGDWRQHFLL